MRFSSLFLLMLLASPLLAQYDDLLHNPKITWVAEYTADFECNPVYSDNLDEEYNWIKVLRLENKESTRGFFSEMEVSRHFSEALLRGLNAGHYTCFADEGLQQPIPPAKIKALLNPADTTPGFDHPNDTFVTVHPVEKTDIELFRIRQVFFYEAGRQQFGNRVLALAPLVNQRDAEGNPNGRKAIFWIKFQSPGKASRAEAEATYLFQTYMYANAPGQNDFVVKKGKLDLRDWTAHSIEQAAHPILDTDKFEPLDAKALHTAVFNTDTIVRFNDEGQTEIERIVENNAILQVEKIRFVQNWAFDQRRHTLVGRTVAVAPLAAIRDEEGNFRYYKPLFYVIN